MIIGVCACYLWCMTCLNADGVEMLAITKISYYLNLLFMFICIIVKPHPLALAVTIITALVGCVIGIKKQCSIGILGSIAILLISVLYCFIV